MTSQKKKIIEILEKFKKGEILTAEVVYDKLKRLFKHSKRINSKQKELNKSNL